MNAPVTTVTVTVNGRAGSLPNAFTYIAPQQVNNDPPVIQSVTALGLKPNEPPNFADLNEEIGRSIWGDALKGFIDGSLDRETADVLAAYARSIGRPGLADSNSGSLWFIGTHGSGSERPMMAADGRIGNTAL